MPPVPKFGRGAREIGLLKILHELDADHPVLIFENLSTIMCILVNQNYLFWFKSVLGFICSRVHSADLVMSVPIPATVLHAVNAETIRIRARVFIVRLPLLPLFEL